MCSRINLVKALPVILKSNTFLTNSWESDQADFGFLRTFTLLSSSSSPSSLRMRPYHIQILSFKLKRSGWAFNLNNQLISSQDDGIGHESPKHGDDTTQNERLQVGHI